MLGQDPTDRANFSTREEKKRVGAEAVMVFVTRSLEDRL